MLSKNVNTISQLNALPLSLDARKQMNLDHESRELALENEYRASKGEEPLKTLEDTDPKIKEFKEILLEQTQYLTADLISTSRQLGYTW